MLDPAPQYWGNPFPGLRPFEEEDAHLFFGRETQVRELLARMDDERFIAVVGLSGSGKSSLVRAGLIPALRRGKLSGAGVRWRVAVMRPGGDPFAALAAALNDPGVLGSSATREATLRASSFGLLHAGKEGRKSGQNLLVVVDQFEELFRLRDDIGERWSHAVDFIAELLATARDFRPEFATYVVLTIRSEYLGDCAQFSGLPEVLNRGQYLVPRLTEDDWYRALRKPAEQAGTPLDEQLLQQLMADAGDTTDQLPVLQHLLMRMWDMRDDTRITLESYKKAGGWAGALNQHLDDILRPFDAGQRDIARCIWQRLTEVGERNRDGRRPARVAELMAIAGRTFGEVAAVVEPFRSEGCNFLVSADHPLREDSIVDISHESLIRLWRTLHNEWVPQEQLAAKTLLDLAARASNWKAGKGDLLGGLDLTRFEKWDRERNQTTTWGEQYLEYAALSHALEFLNASRRAARRRRAAWAASLLVIAGLAGWMAYTSFQEKALQNQLLARRLNQEETLYNQLSEHVPTEVLQRVQTEVAAKANEPELTTNGDPAPSGRTPRLYIQVRTQAEADAVRALEDPLRREGVRVPPTQVLNTGPSRSELRYFRKGELPTATRILELLQNTEAADTRLTYVSGFEKSERIRENHFELWFVPQNLLPNLVQQLNDQSADVRKSAGGRLARDYRADPQAIRLVLDTFAEGNLESLSADGRINALYFLNRTDDSVWTDDLKRQARESISRIRSRARAGISIGQQTQQELNALERKVS
jgi:adenylylsulfate kinase-like enzyme